MISPTGVPYTPYPDPASSMTGFAPGSSTATPSPLAVTDAVLLGGRAAAAGGSVAKALRSASQAAPELGKSALVSGSLWKATRNSALFGGLVSGAVNLYRLAKGEITGTRAAGNVTADVTTAVGGGLAASALAGVATAAVGGALPAIGVTAVGFVVGAGVFLGIDWVLRKVGITTAISDKVTGFLDRFFQKPTPPGGI